MGEAAPFKVMVVEDDDEVARAVARRLGADGHEVEVSSDPAPIIARLDADVADWDVVILDVGLPVMSGLEVLARFREAGSLSAIIMLTGDSTANTAAACMRAGAFYYLTKPFEAFQLSSMVLSAARYARLRREMSQHTQSPANDSMLIGQSAPMRRLRDALERL